LVEVRGVRRDGDWTLSMIVRCPCTARCAKAGRYDDGRGICKYRCDGVVARCAKAGRYDDGRVP